MELDGDGNTNLTESGEVVGIETGARSVEHEEILEDDHPRWRELCREERSALMGIPQMQDQIVCGYRTRRDRV